jgi:hypothetical protein
VDKAEGNLKWNFKKGQPRVLKFIGVLKLEDDGEQGDKWIAVQCITRNLHLVFKLNWERGWELEWFKPTLQLSVLPKSR